VIEHYNRLRSATITATPVGMPLGNVMDVVDPLIRAGCPTGSRPTGPGESRDLRDTTNEVWFVLVLALVIVYMVLAAQFESLVHPLTVMLAVPLAAVGALGLLWLMDVGGQAGFLPAVSSMNINLFSQIGLVLLVGLVTKNHSARRVRQPPAHPRRLPPGTRCCRRDHPAAADPDDGIFDHRRHSAHRDRVWGGGGKPPSDGHGGGGRVVDEHVFDLAGHSRGLHGIQRFGRLCPAPEAGDRGAKPAKAVVEPSSGALSNAAARSFRLRQGASFRDLGNGQNEVRFPRQPNACYDSWSGGAGRLGGSTGDRPRESRRVHADRIVGGDRDHCDTGGAVVASLSKAKARRSELPVLTIFGNSLSLQMYPGDNQDRLPSNGYANPETGHGFGWAAMVTGTRRRSPTWTC
jgi:hypothetical protein